MKWLSIIAARGWKYKKDLAYLPIWQDQGDQEHLTRTTWEWRGEQV